MSCGAGFQLGGAACPPVTCPHHTRVESNVSATSWWGAGKPLAVGSGSLCTRQGRASWEPKRALDHPCSRENAVSPPSRPSEPELTGRKGHPDGIRPEDVEIGPSWITQGALTMTSVLGRGEEGTEEVAGGMGARVAGAESPEDTALRHGTSDPWPPE